MARRFHRDSEDLPYNSGLLPDELGGLVPVPHIPVAPTPDTILSVSHGAHPSEFLEESTDNGFATELSIRLEVEAAQNPYRSELNYQIDGSVD
jgi:hypothetical protein